MKSEPVKLTRDCQATAIPGGEQIELRQGDSVIISQALGGTFTVMTEEGYLARIAASDADALGQEVPRPAAAVEEEGLTLEDRVRAELKSVYDPEIPVDIVELGLIYGVEIASLPDGQSKVHVTMTMTAPGCGMGDVIRDEVLDKLRALPGVGEVKVEIVLDPPWEPSRMSEAARLATGMYW